MSTDHLVDEVGRRFHAFNHDGLDLDELGRRISAGSGAEVAVIARCPSTPRGRSQGMPGVIRFEHMNTNEPIDIDPRLLNSVIDGMIAEIERAKATVSGVHRDATSDDGDNYDHEDHEHHEVHDGLQRWVTSAQRALDEVADTDSLEEKVTALTGWLQREMDAVQAVYAAHRAQQES